MRENIPDLMQDIVDQYFYSVDMGNPNLTELIHYCLDNGYVYHLLKDSVKFYERIDSNNLRFAFEIFKTLSESELKDYAKKFLTVKWKCILDIVPISEHIGWEVTVNPSVPVTILGRVGYFLDKKERICIQLVPSDKDSSEDLLKYSTDPISEKIAKCLLKHPNIMYVQLFRGMINGESCVYRAEVIAKKEEL